MVEVLGSGEESYEDCGEFGGVVASDGEWWGLVAIVATIFLANTK